MVWRLCERCAFYIGLYRGVNLMWEPSFLGSTWLLTAMETHLRGKEATSFQVICRQPAAGEERLHHCTTWVLYVSRDHPVAVSVKWLSLHVSTCQVATNVIARVALQDSLLKERRKTVQKLFGGL